MKAISLWQPWASLMAYGFKTVETRSWNTSHRGPLLIHAGKRPMPTIHKRAMEDFESKGINWRTDLPYGCIVAQVELIAIWPAESWAIYEKEGAHGDYSVGRYAWVTDSLKRFLNPIPFRGWQRIFKVPDDIL